VFCEEKHPNVISGRGRSKEGFSLMAILDRTRSEPGRVMLREWLSKPLASRGRILRRQAVVELLTQADLQEALAHLKRFLSKVADAAKCLVRLRRSTATYKDWLKICAAVEVGHLSVSVWAATHGGPLVCGLVGLPRSAPL
jgi:DNA mismatch repair ATPase MutS